MNHNRSMRGDGTGEAQRPLLTTADALHTLYKY